MTGGGVANSAGALRTTAAWAAVYAGVWLALLAIHAGVVNVFLYIDDLSHLRVVADDTWAVCLQPMSNGFWRPLTLLLTKLAYAIGGLNPLPYHLLQLALHAAVAVAFLPLMLAVRGLPRFAAVVALIVFMVHPATWETAALLPNSADAGLALFMIGAFCAWMRAVERPGGPSAWASSSVALLLALSFASKETAIVAGVPIVVYSLVRHGASRRERAIACALALACLAAGAASAWRMANAESYLGDNRFDPAPHRVLRRFLDFMVSPYVPYLHVVESPFVKWEFPNLAIHAVRLATVAAYAIALLMAWRRRWAFGLACMAAVAAIVAPASLLDLPMPVRYVYAALPFAIAAVVVPLAAVPASRRQAVWLPLALYMLYLGAGVVMSPMVRFYQMTGRELEALAAEMRRREPAWPPGASITILGHPHPGGVPWQWVYVQHMTAIHVGRADLIVNLEVTPDAYGVYLWNGSELVEVPASRPAARSPSF